ncbi:hypothetical protein [Spirosoma arcticum]
MKHELSVPTAADRASFLELFDRYTRRTADIHQLSGLVKEQELVNEMDLSALSATEQSAFHAWLNERPYTYISIGTLLLRGLRVKIRLINSKITDQATYSIHTKDV